MNDGRILEWGLVRYSDLFVYRVHVRWTVVDDQRQVEVMVKNDIYDMAEDFIWFRFKWGLIVLESVTGTVAIGLFLLWITGNLPW